MDEQDRAFHGNIAGTYDRYMGPLFFEPYAHDLARRTAAFRPRRVLEVAAGTGIVTCALVSVLAEAELVATDLNEDMLALASTKPQLQHVRFGTADAMQLPFEDSSFDALVCQFGVMFFPDRVAAYREALRVLRKGGVFIFNAWDTLDSNPVSRIVAETIEHMFPEDPPSFIRRVPFGYHDKVQIEDDLHQAGFANVAIETVPKRSRARSARDAAVGLCAGTPTAAQMEGRGRGRMDEAIALASERLAACESADGLDAPMSAHVVIACG